MASSTCQLCGQWKPCTREKVSTKHLAGRLPAKPSNLGYERGPNTGKRGKAELVVCAECKKKYGGK